MEDAAEKRERSSTTARSRHSSRRRTHSERCPAPARAQRSAALARTRAPNGTAARRGSASARSDSTQPDHAQLRASARLRVSGRLVDAQGQPIAGATLDVLQQVSGSASLKLIGHASTSANGTFAGIGAGRTLADDRDRIPRVLHRRGLRRDGDDHRVGGGRREAQREPHSAPARKGRSRSAGSVLGPVPPKGVSVDLLVHYRGHWEPFRTPQNRRRGSLHGRLPVRGSARALPVPGGSARRAKPTSPSAAD